MIDLKDLNAIYDPSAGDQDPKPKPNKVGHTDLGTLGDTSSPVKFGTASDVNVEEYTPYLENGVYENRDIDIVRGEKQSVGTKLGLRLANMPFNILGSAIKMIGYTGALATEWGDNRDYSNIFTDAGEAIMNPLGKTFRRSHDVFALGDPTWWIDNVADLAEIAIPFAGEAKLASAGMSMIAKSASNLLKLGEAGTRAMSGAAQLATAGYTAYTEAAMDGASVYDKTYDYQLKKQLAKGLDPEAAHTEAQHLAAQSAATTVQLSTAMTTLLNLSAVAPFFKKSDDTVKDVLRNQLSRLPGEEAEAWATRIKNLKAEDFPEILGKHGSAKFLGEMAQEGVEEIGQTFSQFTGEEEGQKGNTHGFLEQFAQLENFFDRTMNAQGALAGILGMAGGGLQTAIIENAPMRRSNIDETGNYLPQAVNADGTLKFDNGNPVMQSVHVSPKTYDEWSTKKVFNNARDMVAEDIFNFVKMQKDYLAAVKKGDAVAIEKARNDMFNVAQMNAITSGVVEPWINTFQEIGKLDNTKSINPDDETGPTEAMQRGYAVDRADSEYQTKANEAANDLKKFNEEYQKLQKRYGTAYEANEGIKDLVNMMFFRKIDLMTNEKLIKHHEQELANMEKEEADMLSAGDPAAFDQSISTYNSQIQSSQEVYRQLKADHDILEKAIQKKDYSKIDPLLRKYRVAGIDPQTAVNDLSAKLLRQMELQSDKAKGAEASMLQSSGYQQWLDANPGGTFEQYREKIQKKYSLNKSIPVYRTNIEEFKVRHNIAAQNYADIHREESIAEFVKKSTDWRNKLQKQSEELQKKQATEISMMAKDKATAARLEAINMDGVAERYRILRDQAVQLLQTKQEELSQVEKEMKGLTFIKDPIRLFPLRNRAKQLHKEIKTLKAQINAYESAIATTAVDTGTPAGDVETGGVIDEDNDLEKEEEQVDGPEVPDLSATLPVEDDVSTEVVETDPDLVITVDEYKQFQDEISFLPREVRERIAEIEDGWRAGTLGFSLNLLAQEVKAKKIGMGKAAHILQSLWEILNDEQPEQVEEEEITPLPPLPVGPKVDLVNIPEPEDPIIDNSDESWGTTLAVQDLEHAEDDKTVNVIGIANSTLEWKHDLIGKTYKKFGTTNLDPKSNPDVITPGKLGPGTVINLVPDVDYDGSVNITGRLAQEDDNTRSQKAEKFTDFLNEDGSVKDDEQSIGNIPIKITDSSGKTIGYVRKLDWVLDKYPGTNNYNNIAQFIYDADGNPIDNVQLQKDAILSLRRIVINKWQSSSNKPSLPAKILDKGPGHLIYNYKEQRTFGTKPKLEMGYADKLLPDQKLQLAIVKSGEALTGKQFPFPGKMVQDRVDLNDGNVVVLLPSANGKYLYAPLIGIKLSQRKTNLQTATRAIELYLKNDGTDPKVLDEIEKLRVATGFDISTPAGLRNFFSQYLTYTQSFDVSHTMANAPTNGQRKEKFLFNISDKAPGSNKAEIKLGWSFTGKPIIKAAIVNGQLDPTFIEALTQGFETRSQQVQYTDQARGIRGINSTGTFKNAVYTKTGWRFTDHDSYNEYVKSFTKTAVFGQNKANGRYVYTANPQMPFEVMETKNPTKVKVVANTSPTEVKLHGTGGKVKYRSSEILAALRNAVTAKITLVNGRVLVVRSDVKAFNYTENTILAYKGDGSDSEIVDLDVIKKVEAMDTIHEYGSGKLLATKGQVMFEDKTTENSPKVDESKASLFDDIFDFSPNTETEVSEIGSPSDGTQPLTLSTLDQIHSVLPANLRNGRTVHEVYDDLVSRGHTFIPAGYNPFLLCM